MTIKEAVKQRHMVRKFTDKPIPADLAELLNARIAENNAAHGLNLKLVTGNADGIGGMAKMLLSRSVHSYIILAGKDGTDLDEHLGYCGADLCLYAQTLGLNTWWVGGMFNGKGAMKQMVLSPSAMVRPRACPTSPKPQPRSASIPEPRPSGLPTVWKHCCMLPPP